MRGASSPAGGEGLHDCTVTLRTPSIPTRARTGQVRRPLTSQRMSTPPSVQRRPWTSTARTSGVALQVVRSAGRRREFDGTFVDAFCIRNRLLRRFVHRSMRILGSRCSRCPRNLRTSGCGAFPSGNAPPGHRDQQPRSSWIARACESISLDTLAGIFRTDCAAV
jgi:hypothetical protein